MQEQDRLWQGCWVYSCCLYLLFVKEGDWFNEKFNDSDKNFLGAPVSVVESSTSQPVPWELYWSCTKNCRGSDGLEKNFGIDSTWSAKCLRNDFFFLLRNRRFGTIQTHDPWLREIIYFFYAESSWHDAMSRRFSVLRDLNSDNSRTKKCSV